MSEGFTVEPLRSGHHRANFSCGSAPLDRYLRELATQDMRRRISNWFVALDSAGAVAGYYTFAATAIPVGELFPEETRRLPHYRAGGLPRHRQQAGFPERLLRAGASRQRRRHARPDHISDSDRNIMQFGVPDKLPPMPVASAPAIGG